MLPKYWVINSPPQNICVFIIGRFTCSCILDYFLGSAKDWICSRCKDFLYYSRSTDILYCQCGTQNLSQVYFRCSDTTHGLRYQLYEEIQLRKDLQEMDPESSTNILILGESGVGKSTWINAFANYLTYTVFDDAEKDGPIALITAKFILNNKEISIGKPDNSEDLRVGQSATQSPISHKPLLKKWSCDPVN